MFISYLKIAWKVLTRRKFFTLVSLFGISFTLMILIVVAALYQNTVSSYPPLSNADRCLTIARMRLGNRDHPTRAWISSPGYRFLDRHIRDIKGAERVSIHANLNEVVSYQGGVKRSLQLKRTDADYWQIMDFEFLEGAPFTEQDDDMGHMVAVINRSTRDQLFPRKEALGQTLTVDGQSFKVIGVVADVPVFLRDAYADLWVPTRTAKSSHYQHELLGGFNATILAHHRADIPMIKQAIQRQVQAIDFPQPERWNMAWVHGDTALERLVRQITDAKTADPGIREFRGAVVFGCLLFMLLPALNLINLNVSRIMERSAEIGVRKAFGATSNRLTAQFLVENLLLTLIGGALGLVGASLTLKILEGSGLIPYAKFHIDLQVLSYGLAFVLVFGLISGVYPAWRMSRQNPVTALKGGAV